MNLHLNLQPLDPSASGVEGQPLAFSWDTKTGLVTGPSAEAVLERVRLYAGKDYGVPLRMPPDSYTVTDPLRSLVQMSVLLGECWKLPPLLEAVYPALEESRVESADIF